MNDEGELERFSKKYKTTGELEHYHLYPLFLQCPRMSRKGMLFKLAYFLAVLSQTPNSRTVSGISP